MSSISILPKVVTTTLTYNTLKITSVLIVPFTSATINPQSDFVDESGSLSSNASPQQLQVFMPTADYLKWYNDDTYLEQYVCSKLGYTQSVSTKEKSLKDNLSIENDYVDVKDDGKNAKNVKK